MTISISLRPYWTTEWLRLLCSARCLCLSPAVTQRSSFCSWKVISLAVKEGDEIEEGQQLAVVEAMKMQNVLRAENAGKVSKLKCKAGDTLGVDAVMMEFEFD